MWREEERCGRLKSATVTHSKHCDPLSQSITQLKSDYLSNQISELLCTVTLIEVEAVDAVETVIEYALGVAMAVQ